MPAEIEDVLRMDRAEISKEMTRWYSSGTMDNASATMDNAIEEYREFMQPQGKGVWKKCKPVSLADLDDDDDVELASAPAMGIKRRREPTLEELRAASKTRRLQKARASSSADAGAKAAVVPGHYTLPSATDGSCFFDSIRISGERQQLPIDPTMGSVIDMRNTAISLIEKVPSENSNLAPQWHNAAGALCVQMAQAARVKFDGEAQQFKQDAGQMTRFDPTLIDDLKTRLLEAVGDVEFTDLHERVMAAYAKRMQVFKNQAWANGAPPTPPPRSSPAQQSSSILTSPLHAGQALRSGLSRSSTRHASKSTTAPPAVSSSLRETRRSPAASTSCSACPGSPPTTSRCSRTPPRPWRT